MKRVFSTIRKFFIFSLCASVILLAGCTAAAVPAAAMPTAVPASPEPPAVTGFEPKSEPMPMSEGFNAAPTLPPQAAGPASASSYAPASMDAASFAQSSGIPSPTPVMTSEMKTVTVAPSPAPGMASDTPAATVVPTVTPIPAPEATKPGKLVYPVNSFKNDSVLCLTFDDGGDKKSVQKALEVLDLYDIQCTFFVIGKYLKPHAELWKQAIEQGHQICNHTQNHKWLSELSNEEVKKEILDWEASAAEALGEEYVAGMKEKFPYLRLPGGAASKSKRVMGILSELGYTPVGWNIESYYAVLRHHDLKKDPVADIAGEVSAHIAKKASGGSIILLHFNPYDTTRLDTILDGILAKKLTMELLSEQDF